jgi:hypothetical protein
VRARRAAVIALAMALGAVAPLLAQPGAGQGQRQKPREEAFRMIEAYLVSNLQEGLALSDDQFTRLLPLVKRLQRDRRAASQRRMKALQELRRVMEAGGASEGHVGDLLREVKAAESEGPATVRRDMDAIDAVLDPVQQAKYRLLEVEVERKLRGLMAEMRGQNRGRRPMELPEN